jgi:hypothetical protein
MEKKLESHAVLFDTNAYRVLIEGKKKDNIRKEIQEYREKEIKKNIQAMASPVVMTELCAYLADINDPAYSRCKMAIFALAEHCKIQQNGNVMIAMLADDLSHICKLLFNSVPNKLKEFYQVLASICRHIHSDLSDGSVSKIKSHIDIISQFVCDVEKYFVADMQSFVVLGMNPAAIDWNPYKGNDTERKNFLKFLNSPSTVQLFVLPSIIKAYLFSRMVPTQADLTDRVKRIAPYVETSVKFYIDILRRIATTGCDISKQKKKRWNWVWDMQLAFYTGPTACFNEEQVYFVTGDSDLITNAKASGSKTAFTLDEYNDFLK